MITAQDVLTFWFSEDTEKHWFVRSDALDEKIIEKFSALYVMARDGLLADWQGNAKGALALVIILDQFPRNMFRGSAQAFASDEKARLVAHAALEKHFDQSFSAKERQFFYLPFMHSENLEEQRRSLELYKALGNSFSLDFAQQHYDIIAQFGRFPHRNKVIGRENTAEETEFLKHHSGF